MRKLSIYFEQNFPFDSQEKYEYEGNYFAIKEACGHIYIQRIYRGIDGSFTQFKYSTF
jgi:hypothetical protein